MHMTAEEALGVAAIRHVLQCIHQSFVEASACHSVINRFAIRLCGACHVVMRFGAAFDLQRMYTELHQLLNMLDGA